VSGWWPLVQGLIDGIALCTFLGGYYMVYRWWMR
jgi:hypothetical protein